VPADDEAKLRRLNPASMTTEGWSMSQRFRVLVASASLAATMVCLGTGVAAAQSVSPECEVTTPEENVAIVQAYVDAHNGGDADAIDSILHDEYVDNNNRGMPGVDETSNADEIAAAQQLEALYPDHETRVDEIKGFDDQVVLATTLIVTKHTLTGSEVTLDTPVETEGLSLFTIECGNIVSARVATDVIGLLTELGFQLVPPTP
jgi:hypothetical protein